MFMPEFIYKYKPYAIMIIGVWAMYAIDHPLALIGGVMLVSLGAVIHKFRKDYAETSQTRITGRY